MRIQTHLTWLLLSFFLSSCAMHHVGANDQYGNEGSGFTPDYADRLPAHINPMGRNTVLVDPNVHAWGAYSPDGSLLRAGLATAGADWCPDLGRRCHTSSGTFHVNSLGSPECKSSEFPIPRGGAPMPYCMFFNRNQALHGVPEGEVVEGNISHGCVRMHVSDAEWLRYNFVDVGTPVIVRPY